MSWRMKRPTLYAMSLKLGLSLLLGQNVYSAARVICDSLGDKSGGTEDTVYPVPVDTLQCVLWQEANSFDRDPNGRPNKEPRENWKKLKDNTAKAIVCRNNAKEGLNKKEVGCRCPEEPLQPPNGESQRIWDDFKKAITDEDGKQKGMTPDGRKAHCKGWHYWYHKDPNEDFGGYMNEDLEKKTRFRDQVIPGRVVEPIRDNGTGRDWTIIFPADQDVPGDRFRR